MAESENKTMLAFKIEKPGDKEGKVVEIPKPKLTRPNSALIRVLRAGVCNTDLEILQGYMGFHGVLGHEFVGIVESVLLDSDSNVEGKKHYWIGKRVCGDINVGCHSCGICHNDGNIDKKSISMSRNHCLTRTVLGILGKDGTMAEYLTLPLTNLHIVPDHLTDEEACFAEPLAAACRIPEQKLIDFSVDNVAVLGDGKLGLMIAEVMGREYLSACANEKNEKDKKRTNSNPILFGKHEHKMAFVADSGVECKHLNDLKGDDASTCFPKYAGKFDVVIDATGSPQGLTLAASMCRPMGTLVLKSTCAAGEQFNAAPFVIDELRVVGSRCGPIDKALELLAIRKEDGSIKKPLEVRKYITKTFPLKNAEDAIKCAAERETMKVQIICST